MQDKVKECLQKANALVASVTIGYGSIEGNSRRKQVLF